MAEVRPGLTPDELSFVPDWNPDEATHEGALNAISADVWASEDADGGDPILRWEIKSILKLSPDCAAKVAAADTHPLLPRESPIAVPEYVLVSYLTWTVPREPTAADLELERVNRSESWFLIDPRVLHLPEDDWDLSGAIVAAVASSWSSPNERSLIDGAATEAVSTMSEEGFGDAEWDRVGNAAERYWQDTLLWKLFCGDEGEVIQERMERLTPRMRAIIEPLIGV